MATEPPHPGPAGPTDEALVGPTGEHRPGGPAGLTGGETDAHRGAAPATRARQAAAVILVRSGAAALELLLVKRNPTARFMGGVWVFPGGALDAGDGPDGLGHRAAAVRELAEEAGVVGVDPGELVEFSRWVTPAELAVRFDTRFFAAAVPDGAPEPRVDGEECVAHRWFTARGALDAHADGRILLVFPTIRQLEELEGFTSIDALRAYAVARRVTPIRPRIVVTGDGPRVVMPGE